ncbi:hypothetical protein DLAC_03243 [Tieghemostelium lacteum]|uniref:ER membrane protein complex subunit 7 beta-sandwich domain-containing protein n=1 Tax=Tieghemostelium lacteum TaxID=361077 RepID=A0A152A1V1_TIELA|nr:hypothetical protein DLAC_03243 [Tieghemostelium lacteum]|eukprot:KYR00097.1 hypothetical protein DLAC_03243 [Tieghemostelium lacteum]
MKLISKLSSISLIFYVFLFFINNVYAQSTVHTTSGSLNSLDIKLIKAQAYSDLQFNLITARLVNNYNFSEIVQIPNEDGRITFFDIPLGTYVLDIDCFQYEYLKYLVDVIGTKSKNSIRVRAFDNDTALTLPLQIKPVAHYGYFSVHTPFSIFSLIKNPMVLSIGVTVGLIFVLPYLTSFIESDEETREQIKGSQPDMIQQMPSWPKFKASKQIESAKDKDK